MLERYIPRCSRCNQFVRPSPQTYQLGPNQVVQMASGMTRVRKELAALAAANAAIGHPLPILALCEIVEVMFGQYLPVANPTG